MPGRLLVLLAALLATSACAESSGGTTGDGASAGRPAGSASALVRTPTGPVGLALDSRGRVWVADADAGTVSRLDPAAGEPPVRTSVGTAPLRLAALDGGVWVSVFSDGLLRRLDERTGRVTRTVRTGAEPEGVTAAFGSVWVVLQRSGQLLRVDPRTGRIVKRYRVGTEPRLVTAGSGALWVSDFETGRLVRVDPRTGAVRRSSPLCGGLQGLVVRAGSIWATCTSDDALVAVDPGTLRRTARLRMPGAPDPVVAGPDGRLLVGLQKGPAVAVVDTASHTVVRRRTLGKADQLYDRANIDLVYRDGRAWLSSYLEDGVYPVAP